MFPHSSYKKPFFHNKMYNKKQTQDAFLSVRGRKWRLSCALSLEKTCSLAKFSVFQHFQVDGSFHTNNSRRVCIQRRFSLDSDIYYDTYPGEPSAISFPPMHNQLSLDQSNFRDAKSSTNLTINFHLGKLGRGLYSIGHSVQGQEVRVRWQSSTKRRYREEGYIQV
eukprot:TRINITY_DN3047_c0_g1_i1.p2 TRINITY_DN3047_c0_g1~~TRINITY_DN3047_c0_g1_i1.p2  ORF type:complete len:166 (-),score=8.39 TRINITY_DN3047_c0_g1_i1:331-828(-)